MPVMPARNCSSRTTMLNVIVRNTARSRRKTSSRRSEGFRASGDDLLCKVAKASQCANRNFRAGGGQLLAKPVHQCLHRVLAPIHVEIMQQVAQPPLGHHPPLIAKQV